MSIEFKEIWSTLSKVDVTGSIEKKGKFSYLSWAWAWTELMKHYPEAEYDFLPDNFNTDGSMEVRVVINIGEHSRFMWLPVMDFSNKAMINPDGMAINKARMRCLVKCIAMFGLGLYIYAGEDLPEKPDYELSEDHKKLMSDGIKAGEKTSESIIKNLEKSFTVSESIKKEIRGL